MRREIIKCDMCKEEKRPGDCIILLSCSPEAGSMLPESNIPNNHRWARNIDLCWECWVGFINGLGE